MMLVYATDLHGDINKYDKLIKFAKDNNFDNIVVGADMLPKGSNITSKQESFIKSYLNKQPVQGFFGNDDLWHLQKYCTIPTPEALGIQIYPYVPDYPFRLKHACKLDYHGWTVPEQFGSPLDDYLKPMPDYLNRSTIEQDLTKLVASEITCFHCPPSNLGLDVCLDGRQVGSRSVLEWISKGLSKIVLCGHIHESYDVTGVWKVSVGNTAVIQPGDRHFVTIIDEEIEIHDYKTN